MKGKGYVRCRRTGCLITNRVIEDGPDGRMEYITMETEETVELEQQLEIIHNFRVDPEPRVSGFNWRGYE